VASGEGAGLAADVGTALRAERKGDTASAAVLAAISDYASALAHASEGVNAITIDVTITCEPRDEPPPSADMVADVLPMRASRKKAA
jgi:hypothetical protein